MTEAEGVDQDGTAGGGATDPTAGMPDLDALLDQRMGELTSMLQGLEDMVAKLEASAQQIERNMMSAPEWQPTGSGGDPEPAAGTDDGDGAAGATESPQ